MNIGNQVAVCVRVSGFGSVRHVGRKAIGRGESRAFSDEEQRDTRPEDFADFIENAHAAMANKECPARGPSAPLGSGVNQRE